MYRLLFLCLLFLTGCNGCTNLKQKVGLESAPTESEKLEDEKQRLEEEKRLLEEKHKLEEEKQRLEDEKRLLKEQQLKDASQLVQKIAEQLKANAKSGFPRTEGAKNSSGDWVISSLELDPWGNSIQIVYQQEMWDEIATVRSAGPDGKLDTIDDITQVRQTTNSNGILHGMTWKAWAIIIWIGMGILALFFSVGVVKQRKVDGKSHKHAHPLIFIVAVMIFGPLAFIIFGLQLVGTVLGVAGDVFDNFDLE